MPFSWPIFGSLAVMFAVSLLMFFLLEQRWTTRRKWVSLKQWARQRRMRLNSGGAMPPGTPPLANARAVLQLAGRDEWLIQLETQGTQTERWNVLVSRTTSWRWSTAALRPTQAQVSLLDRLGLSPMPTPAGAERFIAMATNTAAARALVESSARGLLPGDIGVLRTDQWLILDFSSRPFDPIELDRMLAIVRQIKQMG